MVPVKSKLMCISQELLLSPVEADRVTKYRFIPAPNTGPEGKPGSWWAESAVWIYGAMGLYQVGKQYEFNLSLNEA
jgi:hypothetical protein